MKVIFATAPPQLLAHQQTRSGIGLLRDLGFLPAKNEPWPDSVDPDVSGLEFLLEELAPDQTFLRLFLQSERPSGDRVPSIRELLTLPQGYLPRAFRIEDACVTNHGAVWLQKHFYL